MKTKELAGLALSLSFVLFAASCGPKISDEVMKKSVPELIADTKSEEGTIRAQAALVLGMKKESAKEAIPALVSLFTDSKPYVQNRAMNALAEIGKPAVPALIEALESSNKAVRFYATQTLGKINTPQAQKAYQEAAKKL